MLGLRCVRAAWTPMRSSLSSTTTTRSLTISSTLQPNLLRLRSAAAAAPSSILSHPAQQTQTLSSLQQTTTPSSIRAFSSTPTLGVKRDTYDPSRRVQKRRAGFLARMRTKKGRQVLQRRKLKGRKSLSW